MVSSSVEPRSSSSGVGKSLVAITSMVATAVFEVAVLSSVTVTLMTRGVVSGLPSAPVAKRTSPIAVS